MAAEPGYLPPITRSAALLHSPAAASSASPADRLSSNQSNLPAHPMHPARAGRVGRAGRLGVVALAFVGAVAFDVPLCPFAILTRHPCPGCGLTRGTLALLHGHLGDALRFHPLVPVVSPLVALVLAWNAFSYVRDGRWSAAEGWRGRWITRVAATLGVMTLAVWVARFLGALGGPVPV
jgi:hypothetical protein